MMNFPWHFRMAFQQLFITSDETQKYFWENITENVRFKGRYHTTSVKNVVFVEKTASLDTPSKLNCINPKQ